MKTYIRELANPFRADVLLRGERSRYEGEWDAAKKMWPICHLPHWIDLDTGQCRHTEHDYCTACGHTHDESDDGTCFCWCPDFVAYVY